MKDKLPETQTFKTSSEEMGGLNRLTAIKNVRNKFNRSSPRLVLKATNVIESD